MKERIPAFAVIGHPNEGKSSIVSTLAEDDSVRISPIPGETRRCREYPVTVDGREVIRFIDTPGFQQPRATLQWMIDNPGPEMEMLADFITDHRPDHDFFDECELLSPLADGAGIIFVVDGSRPVRSVDKIEMEILRLTGLPRMAVINTKEKNRAEFLDDWKSEARKHFNTIRLFDAKRATYAERIDLLESLKGIDPDWQPALVEVIDAFKNDWDQRLIDTSTILMDLLAQASRYAVKKTCPDEALIPEIKKTLQETYRTDIDRLENAAHKNIRKRFKHNIFNYEFPPTSILNEDLFSKKSWRVLGLRQWQLVAAGGAGGGAVGAKIDLVTGGQSLGLFAAIGGLIGAGSALLGLQQAARSKVKGLPLGRMEIQVGPVKNEQLNYVLTNRVLIYFSHVINWAHSRRDTPEAAPSSRNSITANFTSQWSATQKKLFTKFFKALQKEDGIKISMLKPQVTALLIDTLKSISLLKQPLE
ncbi:MAG: DUF3482 domain-containing protein [Desulfobacteraceae bacterium]|nr:MAG: DUF3482 domain-containing protein [Desulfobacteraceae bacterium]